MSVVKEFVNFRLTSRELLGGEVLFYLPIDVRGQVVGAPQACLLHAYLFNWVKNAGPIIPCEHSAWDSFALCLYDGKLGHALDALGKPAFQFEQGGYGSFQRYEPADLKWESS